MHSIGRSLVATLSVIFILALPLAAQPAPVLVAVPVARAAAVLDFNLDAYPRITLHPSGCVAMFDTDASQVVCIDPSTGASHRFGRNGSGPGEFLSVGSMLPTADGGLLVFDGYKNERFTAITPDWKLGRILSETQACRQLYRPTRDSVIALGGGARG